MHIDPIKSMNYQGSNAQIPMKNVIIFLCNEENVILNMTENVRKLIGLSHKRIKEEEEILGRTLQIDDVIPDFYNMMDRHLLNSKTTFLTN